MSERIDRASLPEGVQFLGKRLTSTYLTNTAGGSSKFYRVTALDSEDGEFVVLAQWGRIGAANPQWAIKGRFATRDEAEAEAASLLSAKRKKGYVDEIDPIVVG